MNTEKSKFNLVITVGFRLVIPVPIGCPKVHTTQIYVYSNIHRSETSWSAQRIKWLEKKADNVRWKILEEDKQSEKLNNGKEWNSEKVISNKGVKGGNIENEHQNEYNCDWTKSYCFDDWE